MSGPAVVFDGVSKSYPFYGAMVGGVKAFLLQLPSSLWRVRSERFEVLKDVSFTVEKGESFGILGRNGAGKSTLLGLIARVLRPTAGRIDVRGRVSPLLELGGGFHHELSGRENILLNGVLLGLSRAEVKRRTEQIIDFSGLSTFIDQPLRTYSSGMTARLGFSVVAHLDPDILLVDEILAVGDAEFQRKCLDKLKAFKRSGVTMILVSHNLEDVRDVCGRALWIEDHRAKMVGAAEDVVRAYKEALGEPAGPSARDLR